MEQTGDLSNLDTRTDKRGRKQPAKRPQSRRAFRARNRDRAEGAAAPATAPVDAAAPAQQAAPSPTALQIKQAAEKLVSEKVPTDDKPLSQEEPDDEIMLAKVERLLTRLVETDMVRDLCDIITCDDQRYACLLFYKLGQELKSAGESGAAGERKEEVAANEATTTSTEPTTTTTTGTAGMTYPAGMTREAIEARSRALRARMGVS
jgi:hypothetical protein